MATDRDGNLSSFITDSVRSKSPTQTDSESEPQIPTDPISSKRAVPVRTSSILLGEDPFGSDESKLLFDAIDQLRSCGAGQDLDLPQLVIVGKQSVGKSSLLESLTEIPFPVGDSLCTRFATRIISRRTPPGTPDMINVSVEKGDVNPLLDSGDDGQTGSFNPTLHHPMTAENFRDVIDQASQAMGILNRGKGGTRNFSSKVLKIELSGPGRSHFGILDLPGIFEAAIGDVTKNEKIGVNDMVTAYMQRRENIIIVVADTDDLANQRILTLAEDHVEYERLVGVITKCDQAAKPERIVEIVQHNEGPSGKPLHHGWFVVRNRGQKDDPALFDREKAERTLFHKQPWVKLDERRRGTGGLKAYLSNLLCRRIREGFPGMQSAVKEQLRRENEHLNGFGKPRPNHSLQRAYLVEITQRFQTLAKQALKSPEDLPSEKLKLRGKVERAKDEFAEKLRVHGHLYKFSAIDETEITPTEEDREFVSISFGNRDGGSNRTLYDEIRCQIDENKGEELRGMTNPAVLKPLLQKQASKWHEYARSHLKGLADLTNEAVVHILESTFAGLSVAKNTQDELKQVVRKFAEEARNRALEELDKFCREEDTFHPQTDNPAFIKTVKDAQLLRFKAALERYAKKNPPMSFLIRLVQDHNDNHHLDNVSHIWGNWAITTPESISALFAEMHSHTEKNTQDEIHDLLKAYYEVIREDFISYVNRHIVEAFLYDAEGPLFGLSTKFIIGLTDEKVEDLGGEDETTIVNRQRVEAKIKRLEAAEEIAQQTLRRTKGLGELRL